MLTFAKGHGTLNDFVLVTDADGREDLTVEEVRFLCDRRAGIGGDGILRATRGGTVEGWNGDPDVWFMDYRNADGSVAEMCGNGVRVFARYLVEEGLVPRGTTEIPLGTRAGLRVAELLEGGRVRVWMGHTTVGRAGSVEITAGGATWGATPVDVGNPHAVVILDGAPTLSAIDLTGQPRWEPVDAFPNGVNVEFVEVVAGGHVRMRVHERGVGETWSCGTGTVAAASATALAGGNTTDRWIVEVPGGRVEVDLSGTEAWLTGPAEIVARGSVRLPGRGD